MITSLLITAALASDTDRVPQDFATIQQAVDEGTAPVIEVSAGRYAGAQLTRPVHVVGHDAVIARGVRVGGRVRAGLTVAAAASGSVIEGFVFDCTSSKLDLGVYGSDQRLGSSADRIEVVDNRFAGCAQAVTNAGSAVRDCHSERVTGGEYWTIRNNTIDGLATRLDRGGNGGGIGILVYNATGADVFGNRFTGPVVDTPQFRTSGVALAGCIDCTVSDNAFDVKSGRYWYASVTNAGAQLPGAAASRNLLLAGNDASADSAPWLGVAFVSRGSSATELDGNVGVAYVDHEVCGDGDLYYEE
ncbi:MAG: hypothetical protein KTR31_36760 [Myxococcales bacterium]|nr:hypothetical protein [Myxococcales bacterium]